MKKEEEEKDSGENQAEMKEEEHGIEMSDDFDGEAYDMEKKGWWNISGIFLPNQMNHCVTG